MKTNPNFKSYAYLINRNLNFESKDKLAQAINVGLIVEGTSILFQNGSYTVTQEDILRATGD